jgi:hypothetical protein
MPTGTSSLKFVRRCLPFNSVHPPLIAIKPEDSYVLVKLHEVQIIFEPRWLARPDFAVFTSAVKSTFEPGVTFQNLHKVETLVAHHSCKLGLSINLTDWLPVRMTDSINIKLTCTVARDTPIKSLIQHFKESDLEAPVALLSPQIAVAIKVSQVVGTLMSYLQKEDKSNEILPFNVDLNLQDLSEGFYAAIGSSQNQAWPDLVCMNPKGQLIDEQTKEPISNCSYVLIEVKSLPRRGEEIARTEPWWQLLDETKQEIIDACAAEALGGLDISPRKAYWNYWKTTLKQVRKISRQQRYFLVAELHEIIQTATKQVKAALEPPTTPQSFGGEQLLPEDWQQLLRIESMEALERSVDNYQRLLSISQDLD